MSALPTAITPDYSAVAIRETVHFTAVCPDHVVDTTWHETRLIPPTKTSAASAPPPTYEIDCPDHTPTVTGPDHEMSPA